MMDFACRAARGNMLAPQREKVSYSISEASTRSHEAIEVECYPL